MKTIILLCCVFVFSVSYLNRSRKQSDLNSFIGTWKGTSLCQVKNSPCHDVTVVYYITKGRTDDSCTIRADKIVNGVEEDMGPLFCRFDKTKDELTAITGDATWNFKLKNKKISGTLIVRNTLYRIVELLPLNKK